MPCFSLIIIIRIASMLLYSYRHLSSELPAPRSPQCLRRRNARSRVLRRLGVSIGCFHHRVNRVYQGGYILYIRLPSSFSYHESIIFTRLLVPRRRYVFNLPNPFFIPPFPFPRCIDNVSEFCRVPVSDKNCFDLGITY